MERVITVVVNTICFLLMLLLVNEYTDSFIVITLIIFVIFGSYLLYKFRKEYIPKKLLQLEFICIILQIIFITIFEVFDIWNISNGFMGLGAGGLGTLFYFAFIILFFVMLLLVNFLKFIFRLIKSK